MVKAIQVLGPYSPKAFSDAGVLSTLMTADIEGLTGYIKTDIISVEPITVLGNIFLVVYAKT